MSVAVSIPSTFAASTTETITDTAISVSKDGIETAGKLFALSVGSTPSTSMWVHNIYLFLKLLVE